MSAGRACRLVGNGTQHLFGRRSQRPRWLSASAQAAAELGNSANLPGGASASLMLGRARLSPSAVVLQSNAVFGKLRGGQATAAQLVEALRQLAAVARDASAEDLETLGTRAPFRQLLEDILRHLPRDAGERTGWGPGWTAQVVEALRELRVREVDPRLGVRLGHTIVQAASDSDVPLEVLCHAVCDLGAADTRGLAPDNYATWMLGEKLKELCEAELGELKMDRLVPLLHLLAHPMLRDRISARWSADVLAHVKHGLTECSVGDVAKLLQAYVGVPAADSIVSEALRHLMALHQKDATLGLQKASIPELAAIAGVLPGRSAQEAALIPEIATIVLERLKVLLEEQPLGDDVGNEMVADIELAAVSIVGAADALQSTTLNEGALADALAALGGIVRRTSATSSSAPPFSPIPADSLAQLLRLGLLQEKAVSASSSAAWQWPLAGALASRLSELTSSRLAELAMALEASELDVVQPDIFQTLQAVVSPRASKMSPTDFGKIVRSLATASVLEPELLDAFDVEASLVRPVRPSAVANIAWSMAVADAGSEAALMLVAAQLENAKAEWEKASSLTRGLLFEALGAYRETRGFTWDAGSAAFEVLSDAAWKENWQALRSKVAPSSAHGDLVALLLEELGADAERSQEGSDGLYLMPFALDRAKVVLDLMASSPRHPTSRAFRGESKLRHSVWAACGRSVLAVPDSMWVDLARVPAKTADDSVEDAQSVEEVKKRQLNWLRAQLDNLRRADLIRESQLQADTEAQLADVPLGDSGVTIDGLRALAKENEDVRSLAVRNFRNSWREPHVRNPTAWLIGIIKKAKQDVAKAKEAAEAAEAAKAKVVTVGAKDKKNKAAGPTSYGPGQPIKRPEDGWTKPEGTPLEEVRPGDRVKGRVTNVVRNRVWADVGFVKDGTFQVAVPGAYRIGDEIEGFKVATVDTKNLRVELELADDSAPEDAKGKESAPKSSKRGKASETQGVAKQSKKETAQKRSGSSGSPSRMQSWRAAATPKPETGWMHESGRELAELMVGEVVGGTVTNVMYKRVWVNIGAAKDGSFTTEQEGHSFKVGDKVEGCRIQSIDLSKGQVVIRPPA